jgi:Mitochondrial domain of unknown function (DUF1713)
LRARIRNARDIALGSVRVSGARTRALATCTTRCNGAQELTSLARTTNRPRSFPPAGPRNASEGPRLGSVIKKRRKKMRKHKKRKLLKRARHKRKR